MEDMQLIAVAQEATAAVAMPAGTRGIQCNASLFNGVTVLRGTIVLPKAGALLLRSTAAQELGECSFQKLQPSQPSCSTCTL